MKPIRLEIDGINSYSKKQLIDFEELTSRGLFGIFGNTGSGKSTILDAITLALYGNIARSSKDFINSNSQKALVDFEFELGMGQSRRYYKITRRFKKKESKDKFSSVSDSVRLMVKDSSGEYQVIADKVGEVNTSIKSILGLEEGDFLKSVVLPQGKFSEFLSLGGKDRRNMLERIFGLEEYGSSLSIKLAREKKDLDSKITSIEAIMTQHENISKEVLSELREELKELINKKDSSQKSFELLKKQVQDLKELESDLISLNKLEETARSLMERDSYIGGLEEKVEISMSVTSIMPDLLEYRSTKRDIDRARKELAKNKDLIADLESGQKSIASKLEDLIKDLDTINAKISKTESIKTMDSGQLNRLNDDLNNKKLIFQKNIQEQKSLNETLDELKSIGQKIMDTKDSIKQDKARLELEETRLREFEDLNRESKLRTMAEDLKKEWLDSIHEGKCECPLCGSEVKSPSQIRIDHDMSQEESYYQKNLEKKKKQCDDLGHLISKNTGLLDSYSSRKEKLESTLENLSKDLMDLDIEGYQKEIYELEVYIKDQRNIIEGKNRAYMDLMKEKSQVDKIISDYKLESTRIVTDINFKYQQNQDYDKLIVEKTDQMDILYSGLNLRIGKLGLEVLIGDPDQVDITELKREYTDLDKIRAVKLEIEDHKTKKTQLDLKIGELRIKIGENKLDKEYLIEKEAEYNKVQDELETLKEKETGLSIKIKDTEERLVLVNQLKKDLKVYSLKMDDVKDLEKLLKGNKFVEYLSQIYLKNIVLDASQRLDWITSGRYAIEINSDYMFVIRDNFNGGMRRSSDTLSGGETFLVSLALALALSSQIQLKGSAPLEFFFLDEGFGSLDSELLDTVMTSLEKLHSNNLSVGIISHVEELKSRVPMKLVVSLDEKDASSKCRIELS
ncbi:SbcC/MukB-like Walker B domain-containing protein [Peptostreptococcus anaerobius]